MQDLKLTDFYNYFKDLKEYVELTNLLKKNVFVDAKETYEVRQRVEYLSKHLNDFRATVYGKLAQIPEVTQKLGSITKYYCTNKKCKHKFEALKHSFLKVIYVCPKCRASTVEILKLDS